jgi:hypothetical protein
MRSEKRTPRTICRKHLKLSWIIFWLMAFTLKVSPTDVVSGNVLQVEVQKTLWLYSMVDSFWGSPTTGTHLSHMGNPKRFCSCRIYRKVFLQGFIIKLQRCVHWVFRWRIPTDCPLVRPFIHWS